MVLVYNIQDFGSESWSYHDAAILNRKLLSEIPVIGGILLFSLAIPKRLLLLKTTM